MTNVIRIIEDDVFIGGNNPKKKTLDFKLLEFIMTVNLNLYEDGKIDRNVYDKMRKSLLKKMTKILA